jgi:hypothetical protein
MNILSQAPDVFARAIQSGLMSYPAGTQLSHDGKPQPKYDVVRHKKSPLEQYACLRAWEMSMRGIHKENIATSIRCPMSRINQVLARGRELYKQRKAKQ